MKIYKCDGKRFSDGVECQMETSFEDEKGYPEHWLTIEGNIKNNSNNSHLLFLGSGTLHFCSWECLYLKLYKNVSKLDIK